ncbi:MAG: hypothetical protein WCF26_17465 [Candidatus Sulfotelmatobacter sp.]
MISYLFPRKDTAIFKNQLVRDQDGKPAVIAYDIKSRKATGAKRGCGDSMDESNWSRFA